MYEPQSRAEQHAFQVGFRVAKPCGFFGKCARGCLATKNYKVAVEQPCEPIAI